MPSPTTLDLTSRGLTELPVPPGDLSGVTELHLDGNALAVLPGCVRGLPALTSLYLAGNPITAVPAWLPDLTHLDLSETGVDTNG
ncbi:hypothetical protein [Dactylosporangium sp. NPDC050588]|uniref:hypothetical protein n=1 Tax=Dactylosporangium sp. NPDC050588 TaxID=3157211 RepID=UPI0033EC4705